MGRLGEKEKKAVLDEEAHAQIATENVLDTVRLHLVQIGHEHDIGRPRRPFCNVCLLQRIEMFCAFFC